MIEKITKIEIIEQEHKVHQAQQVHKVHKVRHKVPGTNGTQGPQGPPGSTINTTTIYTNLGPTVNGTQQEGFTPITSIAICDPGDTALSGSFDIFGTAEIKNFKPLATREWLECNSICSR